MTSKATKAEPLTEARKAYARTATRAKIASAIWRLWKKISQEQGLDQQWLADRMGTDKARVSRLLKAPGNWTIDTVADLLEAMESRLTDFQIVRYSELLGKVEGGSTAGRISSARTAPPLQLDHDTSVRISMTETAIVDSLGTERDEEEEVSFFTTHSPSRTTFALEEEGQ